MQLVRANRRLTVPIGACVAVGAWLAVLALIELLRPAGYDATMCIFRRTTGVPCPTCGTTRAVLAASEGRLLDAVLFNPLLVAAAVAAAGWLVLRVGFGRAVRLEPGPRSRVALWVVFAVAFVANWAYVIGRG